MATKPSAQETEVPPGAPPEYADADAEGKMRMLTAQIRKAKRFALREANALRAAAQTSDELGGSAGAAFDELVRTCAGENTEPDAPVHPDDMPPQEAPPPAPPPAPAPAPAPAPVEPPAEPPAEEPAR